MEKLIEEKKNLRVHAYSKPAIGSRINVFKHFLDKKVTNV